MADAPDVPDVSDPFGRRVALTIAVLAVILSIVSTIGDNAKSDGLLAATHAANSWAYFQAKSIKEHTYDLDRKILEAFSGGDDVNQPRRSRLIQDFGKEVRRYEAEKAEIERTAKSFEAEVERKQVVNDRCDQGAVLLQVGIVLGSVAILVHWRAFWLLSIVLGLAGAAVSASSWFV
jgi:hypothetical protein